MNINRKLNSKYNHKRIYRLMRILGLKSVIRIKKRLEIYGMEQSMSRAGRCIDNGPMGNFWGILKAEKYYLKNKYETFEELETDIKNYITFYNNKRLQKD